MGEPPLQYAKVIHWVAFAQGRLRKCMELDIIIQSRLKFGNPEHKRYPDNLVHPILSHVL